MGVPNHDENMLHQSKKRKQNKDAKIEEQEPWKKRRIQSLINLRIPRTHLKDDIAIKT
jgi:hypothetical protein